MVINMNCPKCQTENPEDANFCVECGGKLEVTQSGFYDGLIPHPIELLIYVLAIAVPYVLEKLL